MKLPAYGRALLDRRRAGDHPLEIALIYGQDWWRDTEGRPRLAIAPEEYEIGRFDFHIVAGLKVTVIDQVAGALIDLWTNAPEQFGIFYDLVRELAEADAYVEVVWPAWCRRLPRSASDIAWCSRTWSGSARRCVWPRWWSDVLDEKQGRRFGLWIVDRVRNNQRALIERERGAAV